MAAHRTVFGRLGLFATLSVTAAVLVGMAAGAGGFTFVYAKGGSYLGSDPAACANCHVMQNHFDAWQKSSHRNVAGCNDCHAPHDFLGKYATKAINGWNHSRAFTTGDFHYPFQVTEMNRNVTEGACRSCHEPIVAQIEGAHTGEDRMSCIRCHRTVGHPTR